jgi:hypothetical protein
MKVRGYNVMRELSDGWSLVAHPNGPAIANDEWLCAIRFDSEFGVVPGKVVNEAIKAVREMTWPLVKEKFL